MISLLKRFRRTQTNGGTEKEHDKEEGASKTEYDDEEPEEGKPVSRPKTSSCRLSRSQSTTLGQKRLMKEYQQYSTNKSDYFTVELVDDMLTNWNIKVSKFDPDSHIAQDMTRMGIPHVVLNAAFPDDYPLRPPFLRVVCPRIDNGFILRGGAICMELLTQKGWSSAYTIEAVVMQFVSTVVKGKGKIAKWGKNKEYKKKDAEKTFREVVMLHDAKGWRTPPKWEG
ncbi:ubiquitin-conjugating enzyme E2Q-like protein 1 [Corticium candelabrum]|uniref:ubiquitin-conjugating enzyme E2Q-like protein 1 n=1 Tax=Corticium candelabrum TaxID=121492 RepID=UPI002E277398|nr:ubiquitin-conjugating enzyme E2Q-like protein 1 [Corticium candelabrum]